MAMEQRLMPKMSQQLRMTPQLQQAIKLLQLSRMELISLVQQEMVENPILEEAQGTFEFETPQESLHAGEDKAQKTKEEVPEVKADSSDMDKVDWENFVNEFSGSMPANSYRGLSGEEMPGLDQTLSTSESLVDHLLEQLRMTSLSDEDKLLGMFIVGNLDERGYLSNLTAEEIAEQAGVTLDDVEYVLVELHSFDPPGVAARDLRECLLIQLERAYPEDTCTYQIVADHIPDLERKSYTRIAKSLEVTMDDVIASAKRIATLEPKPGRGFVDSDARYITPDIYIRYDDGDYHAVLNEDGLPRLRISSYYKQELKRKRDAGERDEVKDYIQDKLRGAMWLIRSIHQRQSTIVKVTESIIKFQRDFFDQGIEHLKPLVLRDVATDIGMHESTVSRVTTNKYVHTPRGIFELKFFFNSKITKHGGDDLASEAVKAKIREIISGENPKKPLSDAKIVKILAEEDIDIARRTVAKYREMMGILSSAKRKQVF
ncbi:MAG: RNA polymerase factor sigma-54 [Myxococcota bacterium]